MSLCLPKTLHHQLHHCYLKSCLKFSTHNPSRKPSLALPFLTMTTLSELYKLSYDPFPPDGSVDEAKLDASINESLDLADSSLQSQSETEVFVLSPQGVDLAVDTDIPGSNAFSYSMVDVTARCDLGTAPTGSPVIVDMLKDGVSMLSSKLSIDAGELTSTTASVPPVLSSDFIVEGDKVSFNVDQVGATIPGQYLTVSIGGQRYDSDALAYITAVEAADGEVLETPTKRAILDFIVGCKTDGIWSAIKASCIWGAARTYAGSLVPLKGVAPSDSSTPMIYTRKQGMQNPVGGNAFNLNYANNLDPIENRHSALFITSLSLGGTGRPLFYSLDVMTYALNGPNIYTVNTGTNSTGSLFNYDAIGLGGSSMFMGYTSPGTARINGTEQAILSSRPTDGGDWRYGSNVNTNGSICGFYSIGSQIDLVKLESRVSSLFNTLNTVIP